MHGFNHLLHHYAFFLSVIVLTPHIFIWQSFLEPINVIIILMLAWFYSAATSFFLTTRTLAKNTADLVDFVIHNKANFKMTSYGVYDYLKAEDIPRLDIIPFQQLPKESEEDLPTYDVSRVRIIHCQPIARTFLEGMGCYTIPGFYSFIFLNETPSEMDPLRKLMLVHEICHATIYNSYLKQRFRFPLLRIFDCIWFLTALDIVLSGSLNYAYLGMCLVVSGVYCYENIHEASHEIVADNSALRVISKELRDEIHHHHKNGNIDGISMDDAFTKKINKERNMHFSHLLDVLAGERNGVKKTGAYYYSAFTYFTSFVGFLLFLTTLYPAYNHLNDTITLSNWLLLPFTIAAFLQKTGEIMWKSKWMTLEVLETEIHNLTLPNQPKTAFGSY